MNITKNVRLIYQIPTFSYHPVNYYICPYRLLIFFIKNLKHTDWITFCYKLLFIFCHNIAF